MDRYTLEDLNHYERIHILKKMEYNLDNYNKIDIKIEIFKILHNCKCCTDHQINKPSIKDLYNFNGKYPLSSLNNIKCCNCPCRHMCRMICKEVYVNK